MNILSEFLKALLFVFLKYSTHHLPGKCIPGTGHNLLEICESPGMPSGPHCTVSLSMDSVIHGHPYSKNTD